ncbi:MAG: DUF2949 domain-containing protein [Cyanobacteria bacterium J06634_5]
MAEINTATIADSTALLEYQLLQFLEEKLSISQNVIEIALNHHNADISLLPITLWKYHLVTLDEVSELLDWMANSHKQILSLK